MPVSIFFTAFLSASTFSLKKKNPDLKLDPFGTDWPQLFLPVLPETEGRVRQEGLEDSKTEMPREGKGQGGRLHGGRSITLLPFMLWDRGSFAVFGVTAAGFVTA